MNNISLFNRVVWAIDPLARDREFQEAGAKVLATLAHSVPMSVKPVGVVLEDQLPYLMGTEYRIEDFTTKIEVSLSKWLHQLNIPKLEPFSLLIEKSFSVKSAVQCLLRFARDYKSDVITATTHAKKRHELTELGSFSESLFLSSEIPLLLVPPKTIIPQSYKEIFFPTDLSQVSLDSLNSIEGLAKALGANVTIFHKVIEFTKDIVEFPHTSDARSNYLERVHHNNEEILNSVVSRLKTDGIRASFIMDRIESEYVSKSITARAELIKDCIIAMVSRTDQGELSLPGSITRQVLRNSSLPVWVLHPKRQQPKIR